LRSSRQPLSVVSISMTNALNSPAAAGSTCATLKNAWKIKPPSSIM
jgi:hypothetical protein